MPKPVLLICHMSTFFTELFRVSLIIKASTQFEPLFLFHEYPTVNNDIAACRKKNITCYNYNGEMIDSRYRTNKIEPLPKIDILTRVKNNLIWRSSNIKKKIARSLFLKNYAEKIQQLEESDAILKKLQQTEQNYLKIFTSLKPCLLLIAGDQVGYDTPILIKAGHENNLATIVIPSTMSNGIEQAEVYYHDHAHSMNRWINRYVAKKYPKWVFEHKGKKLLRVNGERALALEKLKISPPLPWIFQSGFSDAIAVESEAMLNYYYENGLPKEQLAVVGSPVNDILFHNLQNAQIKKTELYKKYELADKPMILTALPCDCLYYPGGRPECEFKEYSQLADFWLSTLAKIKEYNIVVSLHPSVSYDSMAYLEKHGVKIVKEDISELIPLCEIFVASVSSTIRWAIASNKPIINYDIYRCRYTDFLNIGGVITVEEQHEFWEALNRLTQDKDFYNSIKKQQEPEIKKWGELDGLTGERILKLIHNLSKN